MDQKSMIKKIHGHFAIQNLSNEFAKKNRSLDGWGFQSLMSWATGQDVDQPPNFEAFQCNFLKGCATQRMHGCLLSKP